MLTALTIRHIALIDRLSLDFAPGMTTLTGETGAGKSILIDAIGLIQGDRANTQLIRAGEEEAEVVAVFDYATPGPVATFLQEQDLLEDELIIRRTLNREGRGKIWINGRPSTAATLKALSALLIDVHGQHHNQKLLEKRYQRALLDSFGGLEDTVRTLGQTARELRRLKTLRDEALREARTRADRRQLLAFQLEEIDMLAPEPDEFNRLHQQLTRLSRQDEWRSVLAAQLDRLFDADENVHDQLGQATHALSRLTGLDERLSPLVDALEVARIQVNETADSLRDALNENENDPAELDRVQQRLDALHQLARKHRIPPEQLDDHMAALRAEAADLEQVDAASASIDTQIAQLEETYDRLAGQVTEQRQAAARKLECSVTESIRQLGMPHGDIEIRVAPNDSAQEQRPEHGHDEITFLISANRGQPKQPLDQIASGGELARVSLAIKTLTAAFDPVETFIFDEVDTGIGGAIAEIVGRHLRALGQTRQVFCVTHLPQVAAQGQHQIQVHKHHHESGTVTEITPLNDATRIEEIARMMAGVAVTEQTREAAREMIAQGQA